MFLVVGGSVFRVSVINFCCTTVWNRVFSLGHNVPWCLPFIGLTDIHWKPHWCLQDGLVIVSHARCWSYGNSYAHNVPCSHKSPVIWVSHYFGWNQRCYANKKTVAVILIRLVLFSRLFRHVSGNSTEILLPSHFFVIITRNNRIHSCTGTSCMPDVLAFLLPHVANTSSCQVSFWEVHNPIDQVAQRRRRKFGGRFLSTTDEYENRNFQLVFCYTFRSTFLVALSQPKLRCGITSKSWESLVFQH